MAHRTHLSLASASAAADAVAARCNGGYIRLYTAPEPASPDTALTTQTLLAELRFGTPAFQLAFNGVATANVITAETSAPATGQAKWFRVFGSDGTTVVFDGNVSSGTAAMVLSTTDIVLGTEVSLTSFTYQQPVE